jgi:hypothetical protein
MGIYYLLLICSSSTPGAKCAMDLKGWPNGGVSGFYRNLDDCHLSAAESVAGHEVPRSAVVVPGDHRFRHRIDAPVWWECRKFDQNSGVAE